MFGYWMGILTVAIVAWIGIGLISWARRKRALHFWQFNLAQVFLLLSVSMVLVALARWWYLHEFLQRG